MITLEEAYSLWHEEVSYYVEANGGNRASAFFETAKEILVDNGDVVDLNYSPYITGNEKVFDSDGHEVKQANIRVDGYNFDNEPNRLSVYTLAILDFNSDDEYKNLITGDLEGLFKRAERFITECISKSLVNRLDSSLPQRPWMLEFEENFNNIDKINIILISNGKFSGRRKEFPAKKFWKSGSRTSFSTSLVIQKLQIPELAQSLLPLIWMTMKILNFRV